MQDVREGAAQEAPEPLVELVRDAVAPRGLPAREALDRARQLLQREPAVATRALAFGGALGRKVRVDGLQQLVLRGCADRARCKEARRRPPAVVGLQDAQASGAALRAVELHDRAVRCGPIAQRRDDRLSLALPGHMVEPAGGLLTVLLPDEARPHRSSPRVGRQERLQQLVGLLPSREGGSVRRGCRVRGLRGPAGGLQVPHRQAPLPREVEGAGHRDVPDLALGLLPALAVRVGRRDGVRCEELRQPGCDGVAELLVV